MTVEHTVKSYDSELRQLNALIVEMGNLTHTQLKMALEAVSERNNLKAEQVIETDIHIDEREHIIDQFAVRLLALRQPVASDLRQVVAALKISSHLERIADYAANIAKRSLVLSQFPVVPPIHNIPRMGQITQTMILGVLEAYTTLDDNRTTKIWKQDAEVDLMYASLIRELLTYMIEDPRSIGPCTHVLFMAKNIERIGDHVTNIAEVVHFITHGKPFAEPRPKVEEDDISTMFLKRDL
jgi:phosphate transport system protein